MHHYLPTYLPTYCCLPTYLPTYLVYLPTYLPTYQQYTHDLQNFFASIVTYVSLYNGLRSTKLLRSKYKYLRHYRKPLWPSYVFYCKKGQSEKRLCLADMEARRRIATLDAMEVTALKPGDTFYLELRRQGWLQRL